MDLPPPRDAMADQYDIEELRRNSESVSDHMSRVGGASSPFTRRLEEYVLEKTVIQDLKRYVEDAVVIVFSAEWCPDCYRNMPVLSLISDATGLEVNVFGRLMRDAKNPEERWKIPPSPPEVKDFHVVRIPLIVVLNRDGVKIGEIVENPPEGQTLEEALLDILNEA
jgi:thiol-disulfide isomerase/thioredoxin